MIRILIGLLGAVLVFAVFLLQTVGSTNRRPVWTKLREQRDTGVAKKRKPTIELMVTKDMILAMVQRGVYRLNNKTSEIQKLSEDEQWARNVIEKSVAQLYAFQPNVDTLKQIVNEFCSRTNKVIDSYQDGLCEFNQKLTQITEKRLQAEKEVYQPPATLKGADDENKSRSKCDKQSYAEKFENCKTARDITVTENDYILSIFDEIIKENTSLQTDVSRQKLNR